MIADPPPALVQPDAGDDNQLIEVVGQRADQAQKIDRRIYRVRENAQSAAADGYQLLRGLPAVTIGPDDQLMLLGNANVTILVDEHPIQGDQALYLRTLHGGDIERIEIITNPSAQFPTVGTGGIVNIVLKKKRADGLTGSANGEISSLGKLLGGVSLKYNKGDWTLDTTVEGNSGRWSQSRYRKYREAAIAPGGAPTIDSEQGGGRTASQYRGGSATLGYAPDPRSRISFGLFAGDYHSRVRNHAEFEGISGDFQSFSQSERGSNGGGWRGGEMNFDRKGRTEGETLKGYALFYRATSRAGTAIDGSAGGGYSSLRTAAGNRAYVKLDWTRPIGKTRILSVGGQFTRNADTRRYFFAAAAGGSPVGDDAVDRFDPVMTNLSAYLTYQQRFGSWTLMPGLRLERVGHRSASPGRARFARTQTDLFPTLHVDHPLAKGLDLSLSYSKRIDRVNDDALRPFPIVLGTQLLSLGNPALRDQSTDSFEGNIHYRHGKLDLGLIVYDRETRRLWGTSHVVNAAGMNVIGLVNTGRKSDRGAEIDLSTPLFGRLKTSASINLFDSRMPVDFGAGPAVDETFRYTGNATITYNGPQRGSRPGDIAQLQLSYDSPSRYYQMRYGERLSISLSFTRSLSRTLAVTASADGIGQRHFSQRLDAPALREFYVRREELPLFKLKLVKTFGGKAAAAAASAGTGQSGPSPTP